MRERIEDLGRILVLAEKLLELPLFEEHTRRNKDFLDWLASLDEEKREDFLHKIPYEISEAEAQISEIILICRGHDFLNEEPE